MNVTMRNDSKEKMMMKRVMSAVCVAAVCSVASAGAQSMGKDKMTNMDKMPKGAVMVTGCVAPGSMADHYMLTNATMSHGAMGKDAMGMKKDAMGGDHAMSYALAGGDLKAHVGHKVEVTGTVAKPGDMGKMKDKDSMGKSDMAKTSTLKVQSVKMLSESCS